MRLCAAAGLALVLALAGCAGEAPEVATQDEPAAQTEAVSAPEPEVPEPAQESPAGQASDADEERTINMKLTIDGTAVDVAWEDTQAVAELAELVADGPLTVEMSMYGGFEQVGPLGTTLTSNDEQTTTTAGDIVLYSGNQIVVFYGSNSWAYTRLGHITDRSAEDMSDLLSNGDVTIEISAGA